jgi:solute carrier family 35 (UDP-galactose transporter), member B1
MGAPRGGLRARLAAALSLSLCAAGIYASYITQGLVSEHLQLKRYGGGGGAGGQGGERFTHYELLNGAQALVCCLAAYAIVLLDAARERFLVPGAPPSPSAKRKGAAAATAAAAPRAGGVSLYPSPLEYWRPALSNAVGPALGMVALRNISYSAQVLSKSCKMVPVMLAGAFLHGAHYSALEYAAMLLVGGGVGLFAAGGGKKGGGGGAHGASSSSAAAAALEAPNAPLGYLLVALNLALDGYTNAHQDDVNRRHPRNSPVRMMAAMNLWGAAYYALYAFVLTSSGPQIWAFCARHPEARRDLLLFCACGAVGQLFIFATIKRFGSVATSLVCTTRKFFSVLASALYGGGGGFARGQWLGVVAVFAGLLGSMALKERQHQQRAKARAAASAGAGAAAGAAAAAARKKDDGNGVAAVAAAGAGAATPGGPVTRRRRQA